jgi:hypothetical protein
MFWEVTLWQRASRPDQESVLEGAAAGTHSHERRHSGREHHSDSFLVGQALGLAPGRMAGARKFRTLRSMVVG